MNGYNIYWNDRLHQAHGRVSIAIRKGLSYKLLQPFATTFIENIVIEVITNNTPTIIIVAYSPQHTPHFMNDIETLTSRNKQFLLFGDSNAKHTSWNCVANNKKNQMIFWFITHLIVLIFRIPDRPPPLSIFWFRIRISPLISSLIQIIHP